MDYNEILCQAIDTIVGKRIAEISYDQTIICTIIDDSKKANGQYKVQSNDKFKFDAYCENTTYKNGYQVNVLVPNGDYGLKKTILGRYTANNDTDPVAYVSPLEKIIPMTANYAGGATTPMGLTANGDKEAIELFKYSLNTNIPYDTLCIKADFKCMLQNYLIRSGNYGLRLIIATDKEIVDVTLDSAKDMFGNPYGFITYFSQQQTYHLNLTGPITGIAGYFYQRNNFTYYDSAEEFDPLVPVNTTHNIFIDNIEVYFGYDVSKVEDNTVKIYTYDSEHYTSDGNLNKHLNLIWYNKTEDDKYLGFDDGIFDIKAMSKERDPIDTTTYYWIEWYRDNNDGTWPVIASGSETLSSITGICHDLYGKTSFKARVYCNGNYYESNTITFINQTLSNADSINSLNLALLLHHGEHSEDAYPYYGGDNNLINISDAGRQRSLWFSYESTIGAILEPSVLEGAKVFWYISNAATMLTAGNNTSLSKVEEGSELESYMMPGFDCYTKVLAVDTEIGPSQQEKTFNYQIQRVFNATNVHNIIKLKIVDKNGHEYLAEKRFIFATSGTCGTDYSLVISEVDGQLAYSGGDYTLTAKLYDGDFQDVAPEGGITIKYTKPSGARDYEIATASTRVEWADNEIIIDAEYPIAWSSNAQYYYQGPTNIIYDSSGVNPVYYNGELAIFNQDNTKVEATWEIYYSQNGRQITDENIVRYLPIIHFNESKKCYYVKAPNMFMNDINVDITLIALQGNTAIWGQPLLIYQNQYASSLLNNWGGELRIDEENNYILSAMLGAGKKNDDNTFSGVLMGEVGAKTEDTTMGTIGLYGVHEGAQSFGLKIDGTMFLGKSGRGQILFDGNNGFIASSSWLQSGGQFNPDGTLGGQATDGMAIDLQNGHIDAYNFKLTSAGLQLNSNPQTGEYYLNAGDENNYIRFGDKLEIKTSGANILLGDTSLDNEISEIDEALVKINADVSGLSTTVSTQGGKISTLEQQVGTISAEVVEKADKEYSGTGFGWKLTADGFVVYKISNKQQSNVFAVNDSGATLAGWVLGAHTLTSTNGAVTLNSDDSEQENKAIAVGSTFYVEHGGRMFSSSGSIGGWAIDTNQLSSSGIVLGGSNSSYTLRTNKLIAVNDSNIKATTINLSTTHTTSPDSPETCRATVAITGLVRIIGFSVSDMEGNCAYYTDVNAYKEGSNIVAVATISANDGMQTGIDVKVIFEQLTTTLNKYGFYVDNNSNVYCYKGRFGDWLVENNYLYSENQYCGEDVAVYLSADGISAYRRQVEPIETRHALWHDVARIGSAFTGWCEVTSGKWICFDHGLAVFFTHNTITTWNEIIAAKYYGTNITNQVYWSH